MPELITQKIPAVVYSRFSSDHQREESIDAQLRAIKDYAERNGYAYSSDRTETLERERTSLEKKISKVTDIILETDSKVMMNKLMLLEKRLEAVNRELS